MADFLISIPAWGDWFVHTCREMLLPSLRAQQPVDGRVRYIVHTDVTDKLEESFVGMDVEFRDIPPFPFPHAAMNAAHKEALREARDGEIVMPLVADEVLSVETLAFCADAMKDYKAVLCLGPRAYLPVHSHRMSARLLSLWGWSLRHSWTEASVFGRGCGRYHSVVYFQAGDSVVAHSFHPHPIAIRKEGPMDFESTIDVGLIERFEEDEVFLVKNSECATLEVSRPEYRIPSEADTPFAVSDVVRWAGTMKPAHHKLFAQRIVLCGTGEECDDEKYVSEILAGLQ